MVFDCRFSLADPLEGRILYEQGHIPGAHYLDLNRDLAGPLEEHGGRHPLPDPADFAATLARFGVGPRTEVVAYDDSRLAFACPPVVVAAGAGLPCTAPAQRWLSRLSRRRRRARNRASPVPQSLRRFRCPASAATATSRACARSRRTARCWLTPASRAATQGLEEPIDPVAGHIPGAINRPWQGVTDADGRVLDTAGLQAHWGDALEAEQLVVYCGSGVTACVNLFSLALLGREDATLYAGSWSDWCSYLSTVAVRERPRNPAEHSPRSHCPVAGWVNSRVVACSIRRGAMASAFGVGVHIAAQDRVTQLPHVDAQLVRAAGDGSQQHPGAISRRAPALQSG